jgi:thiol-disulfide isomerase/thioredoxin
MIRPQPRREALKILYNPVHPRMIRNSTEAPRMTRVSRLATATAFVLALAPVLAALLSPAIAGDAPASGSGSGEVTLTRVNWNEFRARLAANPTKAKYTLVDAWATNCGPCKENFPHLVEMHQKYAKKGLAVASLSLDDVSDAKAIEEAKAFLKSKKAVFANYLMNEEFGVGFEKLEISAIPAVFLYGPDGKELKRYTMEDATNQFTYEQVEKEVAALLDGKPPASK